MKKHTKSKQLCSGCTDNFYNGNNPYGIKECSHYKNSKVVKKVIAKLDEPPPFFRSDYCLDCYRQKGYVFLTNFDTITKGKYKGKYCYAGDRYRWEY